MAHNSWPVAHLSFDLGQNFGNPYFKWTDLVVKIDHQKRGSPKKTRVPQRLQKIKRGGDYLFCVKKTISPKLDSPENNPSMTSFLHQLQSFRVLFTNIYIFCLSFSYTFTYYLTQISYHDIPQAHFNHFQPPSPIPAHLMEPCFLSPDSVQL